MNDIHKKIDEELSLIKFNVTKKINNTSLIYEFFCYWRKILRTITKNAMKRVYLFKSPMDTHFYNTVANTSNNFDVIIRGRIKKCNDNLDNNYLYNKIYTSNSELYSITVFYFKYLLEYDYKIKKPDLEYLNNESNNLFRDSDEKIKAYLNKSLEDINYKHSLEDKKRLLLKNEIIIKKQEESNNTQKNTINYIESTSSTISEIISDKELNNISDSILDSISDKVIQKPLKTCNYLPTINLLIFEQLELYGKLLDEQITEFAKYK
jgi:hypothetical protein